MGRGEDPEPLRRTRDYPRLNPPERRPRAPGSLCAEAGRGTAAPFPAPLCPLTAAKPPLRSRVQVSLDDSDHFLHNQNTNVGQFRVAKSRSNDNLVVRRQRRDLRAWWCGKRPTSLCLRPTVCPGHSPDQKLMAYRLNFGALPFPLPRTLRKRSRNAEKRTNSAFTASHQVPS